jgi:hypothetical protein
LKILARLGEILGRISLVEPVNALKEEIGRIRIRFALRPCGDVGRQLRPERIGKLGDDLVLKVEQIGDRLVERVAPELAASLRVGCRWTFWCEILDCVFSMAWRSA